MRIFLVEDDPDTREVLAEILTDEGHDVTSFGDPKAALSALETGAPPGLVFLDLMMEGMTGIDFRKRMLESPALSDIPVILLTGASDAEGIARSVKAHGALRKPVSVEALCAMVARYTPE